MPMGEGDSFELRQVMPAPADLAAAFRSSDDEWRIEPIYGMALICETYAGEEYTPCVVPLCDYGDGTFVPGVLIDGYMGVCHVEPSTRLPVHVRRPDKARGRLASELRSLARRHAERAKHGAPTGTAKVIDLSSRRPR